MKTKSENQKLKNGKQKMIFFFEINEKGKRNGDGKTTVRMSWCPQR